MSDKLLLSGQASQRKPSANRNIKKLRTVSLVCGLTGGWQQWVTENEKKQAAEPSGWAPPSQEGPPEEPRRTWAPKKPPPTQPQPTAVPHVDTTTCGGAQKNIEEVTTSTEPPVLSPIKTKHAVKTVNSGALEKGAGVVLLTEKIQREAVPSGEEIDRSTMKRSSPTCRRKCSNVVSSLTKGWKQVEKEQQPGKGGAGSGKGKWRSDGLDKEEGGHAEAETQGVDMDDAQRKCFFKEMEQKGFEGDTESAVSIKRPQVSTYKKEAEDANKINALSKTYSAVGNLKSRWHNWASEHTVSQRLNPFSENFDHAYSMSLRLQKGQEGYGRPKEGTQTAERAKRAEQHIHREIADMCYVIRTMADPGPDGKTRITFGELFDRYVRISDKVVGILMRARKHGKVAFEGEMLWQGQDDGVIITLLV